MRLIAVLGRLSPGAGGRPRAARAILSNAGSLVGSIAITSLLGFPYWWLAAQSFPAAAVGFAAATVSAMTLLGTIGMLGLGTLLTSELPRRQADRSSILATGLAFAACAGVVLGLVFAVVAPGPLGLSALGRHPGPISLFAVGVALTSVTMVIDQALIGLLRGALQLWRNALFSASKLALLAVVGVTALSASGPAIYATWVAGLAISLGWLAVVARRIGTRLHDYRPRWSLIRDWRRAATEHHILNLALQAPTLMMPLVVTATISITASAYYYAASLITGFLAYGAIALTYALYAVGVRAEESLAPVLRFTLRLSFGVVLAANAVLVPGAGLILRIFGREYAENAATTLRILGVIVCLTIVKDHYVAICRIRGTVLKAAIVCTAAAVLETGLAALGGAYGGLTWLVLGPLGALALETIVMAPTLIRELRWREDAPEMLEIGAHDGGSEDKTDVFRAPEPSPPGEASGEAVD
jgi:O-antigen/teichoic acid export membrane protein